MRKRLKKLITLLCLLILWGSASRYAGALEMGDPGLTGVEPGHRGSILLILDDGEKSPVADERLEIFMVARVAAADSGVCYKLTTDFADLSVTPVAGVTGIGEVEEAVFSYIKEKGLSGRVLRSDDQGQARFAGLDPGLYFIRTNEEGSGRPVFRSFLAELPQRVGKNGILVYDIVARPKVGPPAPTEPTATKPKPTGTTSPGQPTGPQPTPSGRPTGPQPTGPHPTGPHPTGPQPTPSGLPTAPQPIVPGQPAGSLSTVPGPKLMAPDQPALPGPGPTTTKPTRLIQTGQLNWPIPVLTVLGILLILAGWFLHQSEPDPETSPQEREEGRGRPS